MSHHSAKIVKIVKIVNIVNIVNIVIIVNIVNIINIVNILQFDLLLQLSVIGSLLPGVNGVSAAILELYFSYIFLIIGPT